MKRERLEDLGRIYVMIENIFCHETCNASPFDDATSKHSIEEFIKKYSDPEELEDLHDWIRNLKEKLEEVYYLAKGDEE